MSNSYTPRQQQYIDSVGGAAHQSAVVIIGILERELAAKEAELERLTAAFTMAHERLDGFGVPNSIEVYGENGKSLLSDLHLRVSWLAEQSRAQVARLRAFLERIKAWRLSEDDDSGWDYMTELPELLASLPDQSARDARVLRAAEDYDKAITELEQKYKRKDLELTQHSTLLPLRKAVRGER